MTRAISSRRGGLLAGSPPAALSAVAPPASRLLLASDRRASGSAVMGSVGRRWAGPGPRLLSRRGRSSAPWRPRAVACTAATLPGESRTSYSLTVDLRNTKTDPAE